MTLTQFLDDISSLDLPSTFNPYFHRAEDIDLDNAPEIRLNNLRKVLSSALDEKVDVLWIARDLGYRGGRRTGLALTDEAHLSDHEKLYKNITLLRSTRGPALAERTASITWNMINSIGRPIFLWNIFPLHPYGCDGQMSNRCHTKQEAAACAHFITWLVDKLNPSIVIAVGNEAQSCLEHMSIAHIRARHPSYGGKKDFEATVSRVFSIVNNEVSSQTEAEIPFLF